MVTIACAQASWRVGDLEGNRALVESAIRECAERGADVVLLPELATSGYMLASRAEAASTALTRDAAIFAACRAAATAHGLVVVLGFCERGEDNRLYNSAALIDETGVRAVYRKTHLWGLEKQLFAAGGEPPPVVATRHGNLGLLICYDLEFPEMPRQLALRGADLIAVPTSWPHLRRPDGERPPEVVIAMAAARTNRVLVACCDRAGNERGQEWTGGSVVIDELGWPVAERPDHDEGLVLARVNLKRAREKAWSSVNDVLGDRRPDLYEGLLEPADEPPA